MASSGAVHVLAAKFLIGNGNIGKTAARWQLQKIGAEILLPARSAEKIALPKTVEGTLRQV